MTIGYARVSKEEQVIDRQVDLLVEYGAEEIIQEKMSGVKRDRAGIEELLMKCRSGDQVMVESISRLGRNTLDILQLIQQLGDRGVSFVSLKENMDTTTPTGKAMFQMMGVISELERNLIAERIREGLKASQRRGVRVGRPKKDPELMNTALKMYDSGDYSIKEITTTLKVSQGTLYRAINERKLNDLKKGDGQ